MKKIIFTLWITLSILLLFLAGCTSKETAPSNAFIGGTKGLSINFVDTQPPDTVLDAGQETFGIAVLLENSGESDVSEGRAISTLSGIDANKFRLNTITSSNKDNIRGKKKEGSSIIDGGVDTIDFGDASYTSELVGDFQTKIKADVCYDYQTQAVFNLCLKKETIQKESSKDVCKIEVSKNVENSGAPIQITSIKESARGNNKVGFTFEIENSGDGVLYSENTFSGSTGCVENDDSTKEKNRLTVIAESDADVAVSCSRMNGGNQGEIKLYDGVGTVICEIDTSNLQSTAFETPLKITLKYMYLESIQKDLLVKKS